LSGISLIKAVLNIAGAVFLFAGSRIILYFSKPFLSISGNEKICLEISNRWEKNF